MSEPCYIRVNTRLEWIDTYKTWDGIYYYWVPFTREWNVSTLDKTKYWIKVPRCLVMIYTGEKV